MTKRFLTISIALLLNFLIGTGVVAQPNSYYDINGNELKNFEEFKSLFVYKLEDYENIAIKIWSGAKINFIIENEDIDARFLLSLAEALKESDYLVVGSAAIQLGARKPKDKSIHMALVAALNFQETNSSLNVGQKAGITNGIRDIIAWAIKEINPQDQDVQMALIDFIRFDPNKIIIPGVEPAEYWVQDILDSIITADNTYVLAQLISMYKEDLTGVASHNCPDCLFMTVKPQDEKILISLVDLIDVDFISDTKSAYLISLLRNLQITNKSVLLAIAKKLEYIEDQQLKRSVFYLLKDLSAHKLHPEIYQIMKACRNKNNKACGVIE